MEARNIIIITPVPLVYLRSSHLGDEESKLRDLPWGHGQKPGLYSHSPAPITKTVMHDPECGDLSTLKHGACNLYTHAHR